MGPTCSDIVCLCPHAGLPHHSSILPCPRSLGSCLGHAPWIPRVLPWPTLGHAPRSQPQRGPSDTLWTCQRGRVRGLSAGLASGWAGTGKSVGPTQGLAPQLACATSPGYPVPPPRAVLAQPTRLACPGWQSPRSPATRRTTGQPHPGPSALPLLPQRPRVASLKSHRSDSTIIFALSDHAPP